jgi:hypothetical protein
MKKEEYHKKKKIYIYIYIYRGSKTKGEDIIKLEEVI